MRMNNKYNVGDAIDGDQVEEVREFLHLITKMTVDSNPKAEIRSGISKASQAFTILRNILRPAKSASTQKQHKTECSETMIWEHSCMGPNHGK